MKQTRAAVELGVPWKCPEPRRTLLAPTQSQIRYWRRRGSHKVQTDDKHPYFFHGPDEARGFITETTIQSCVVNKNKYSKQYLRLSLLCLHNLCEIGIYWQHHDHKKSSAAWADPHLKWCSITHFYLSCIWKRRRAIRKTNRNIYICIKSSIINESKRTRVPSALSLPPSWHQKLMSTYSIFTNTTNLNEAVAELNHFTNLVLPRHRESDPLLKREK